MVDFFKYIGHCISGALGYLCGYAPDNYTWKDLGVAILIIVLIVIIILVILFKLKIIRWKKPKNNFSKIDED